MNSLFKILRSNLLYPLCVWNINCFCFINNLISSFTQGGSLLSHRITLLGWKIGKYSIFLIKELDLIMIIMARKKFIPIEVFNCSVNQIKLGFTIIAYLTGVRWGIFYFQIKFGVDNLMMEFRVESVMNSWIHYQI